ncbi:S1 family peptidase [Mesorhizobium sp. M0757]|uniref:trypsin-like serine protease n=1 Tax=Mesorhizobium sp. M0757 TaxID=2956993 RepID=UPI003335BC38
MTSSRRTFLLSHILAMIVLVGLGILAWPHPSTAQEDCRIDENRVGISYADLQKLAPEAAEDRLAKQFDCAHAAAPASDPSIRVADGHVENFENFFDVVKIVFDGESRCTGVLVALDTVLTAGHCSCGSGYALEVQYTARLNGNPPSFARLIVTDGPIRFPGYRCDLPPDLQPGRDLALFRIAPWQETNDKSLYNIELAQPLGLGTDRTLPLRQLRLGVIRPTVLVLGDKELHSLYLVGFGLTEKGVLSNEMRGAFVGVLSRFCTLGRIYSSYCAMYGEFALARGGLAADAPAPDSCGGDSGGPVYRMDSELTFSLSSGGLAEVSRRTLVGIVSRGIIGVRHPYPGFCGGGGIYTAVGTKPVLQWLAKNRVAFEFTEDAKDVDVTQQVQAN